MEQSSCGKIVVGTIAICGLGTLGMITESEPKVVKYSDGSVGVAYVGVHLTDKIAPIGSPWSSRNPKIVGYMPDLLLHFDFNYGSDEG